MWIRGTESSEAIVQADIAFGKSPGSDVVRVAKQDGLGYSWVWFNLTAALESALQP